MECVNSGKMDQLSRKRVCVLFCWYFVYTVDVVVVQKFPFLFFFIFIGEKYGVVNVSSHSDAV